MNALADVTASFDALKNCPTSAIHEHLPAALRQFRFVDRSDRRRIVDDFARWTSEAVPPAPVLVAYALLTQAMDRFMDEDLRPALPLVMQARALFAQHDEREGLGLSAMLVGAIYRTLGNFDLALKSLWEAYELLRTSGRHPVFLAATANSLANIELELGHLEEARSMFQATCDECERADDFYFHVYGLHGLARVHLREQRRDDALAILRQSLDLAERHQHPLHISNSLTELASFHFELGQLDEAEALSARALEIRERHLLMAGAVTNCLRLADVQCHRSRWDDALPILQRALAIAQEIDVKPKIAQVHEHLSRLYERVHDSEKSLYHFKLFHALREEIEREDSARKLADAKTVFEAEQARKENATIKAQKAEIEIKNRELQDTIDELTRAKIGRKAKAMTLALAIVLFIFQDAILGTALRLLASNNYFVLLAVKMAIIFSLSPINRAIERHLLKRVAQKRARPALDPATT
jgi:tetratricopeptide (TPR) repeat protein